MFSRGSQDGLMVSPQSRLDVCCCRWMCKHDTQNGIAVHSWTNQHQVDWEQPKQEKWKGTTGGDEC